jgi:hypothetical protein
MPISVSRNYALISELKSFRKTSKLNKKNLKLTLVKALFCLKPNRYLNKK